MNASTRKLLMNLITFGTEMLELSNPEDRATWNFSKGYRAGFEHAARIAGLTEGEIMQAQDVGAMNARTKVQK